MSEITTRSASEIAIETAGEVLHEATQDPQAFFKKVESTVKGNPRMWATVQKLTISMIKHMKLTEPDLARQRFAYAKLDVLKDVDIKFEDL